MSASTAPAAVPEPNNTPGTTAPNTPEPGFLTSLLTPVAPARSATFTLDEQTADGAPATGADSSEQVSSNAFHDSEDGQQDTKTGNNTGSGKAPQGVVRAWLLAGAERWRKGAGANVKRLEVKAAQARAHQVKETRQVTTSPPPVINRPTNSPTKSSGGTSAKGGGAAGGRGKSLDNKSTGGGAAKGPKNSPGTAPHGGTGRRTAPTGGTAGAGGSGAPSKTTDNRLPKQRTPNGKSPGTGNSSKNTPAGPTPRPAKDTPGGGAASKGSTSPAGTTKNGKTGPAGPAGQAGGKGPAPKGTTAATGDKKDTPADPTKTTKPSPAPTGSKDTKTPGKTTPDTSATKSGPDEKRPAAKDTAPTPTTDKTTKNTNTPAPANTGKKIDTRKSRETGYRDGTRGALATAHIKAYRDGVRDGWADTTEAATRDKARLDQAHTDRKTARQETPVPLATSADHHTPTEPIPVDHVTSTHIHLGAGAHQASMPRGEVRSLKKFERLLEEKAARLDAQAEQTRGLKAHAETQARDAGRLLDAARSAEAGDKYIGTLTRLQEAAQVQAAKAEDIHKTALRGAEQCRTTLTNVQTRYGGIYQAVVDSPETSPAELDFYKG